MDLHIARERRENTNKHTKRKNKTNKRRIEFNDKEYKVSSDSCVWLCPNAKTKDHMCKFALCDKCYMDIAPARKRRRGKPPSENVDNGVRCNHKAILSLEQFFDEQYFKNSWKEKMVMENGSFPSLCNKCKRILVS